MSALSFLGGLAGAYTGIAQGYNDAKKRDDEDLDREQRKSDREQQKADREFQLGQRKRVGDEQQRADKLRTANAAVPLEQDVDLTKEMGLPTVDDEGNTMPAAMVKRKRPEAAVASDYAKNFKEAGDLTTAKAYNTEAKRLTLEQASRQLSALMGMSAGMTDQQLADASAKLFNSDGLPSAVRNMKVNPDGSFTGEMYNMESGVTAPVNIPNRKRLLEGLQAHYQPENYNKLQLAAQEAAQKTHEIQPGGVVVRGDGTVVASNANEPAAVQAARIRAGNGGGAGGAGGAGGGKPVDPLKGYAEAFEMAAIKGETKLTPNQIADGNRIVSSLAKNNYDQGTAVKVALDVAMDPTKARLEINEKTGEVDRVYRNPDVNRNESIIISRGAGSLKDMEKQAGGPAQMKAAVASLVEKILPPGTEQQRAAAKQQLISIASDKDKRASYLAAAKEAGKDVPAITRQLDLVAAYAKPEGAGVKAGGTGLQFSGGMSYTPKAGTPENLAGRALAAEQQKAEAAQAAASKQKAAAEAKEARANEVAWLTEKEAAVMTPSEARGYLQKYQDVLPANVARALRRRE